MAVRLMSEGHAGEHIIREHQASLNTRCVCGGVYMSVCVGGGGGGGGSVYEHVCVGVSVCEGMCVWGGKYM